MCASIEVSKSLVYERKAIKSRGNSFEIKKKKMYAYMQSFKRSCTYLHLTDGIVPKNQYGNIDVYTKTMLPENSILIECDENCSMKMLQNAANLLAIDYAKAIVSV